MVFRSPVRAVVTVGAVVSPGAATMRNDTEPVVETLPALSVARNWTAYTAPVVVTGAGAHTVGYRATDTAGNTAAEQTVRFTVAGTGTDACPGSDTRDTVVIDGADTGVPNADTGNGCTINDLIAERAAYPTHAAFVRHVETVTTGLVGAGKLTHRQAGTIVRTAARSDVGAGRPSSEGAHR